MEKVINKNYRRLLYFLIICFFYLIWRYTQVIIGHYKIEVIPVCGIFDQLLNHTSSLNEYLHNHHEVARWTILLTSLVVDLFSIFFIIHAVYAMTIRWILGFFFLLILRQFTQVMVAVPVPEGMIWFYPGFPSIGVTYEVSNDFFMSGHVAFTTFCSFALNYLFKSPYVYCFRIFIILFEVVGIAALRGHYFMDMYAGFFSGLAVFYMVRKVSLPDFLEAKSK